MQLLGVESSDFHHTVSVTFYEQPGAARIGCGTPVANFMQVSMLICSPMIFGEQMYRTPPVLAGDVLQAIRSENDWHRERRNAIFDAAIVPRFTETHRKLEIPNISVVADSKAASATNNESSVLIEEQTEDEQDDAVVGPHESTEDTEGIPSGGSKQPRTGTLGQAQGLSGNVNEVSKPTNFRMETSRLHQDWKLLASKESEWKVGATCAIKADMFAYASPTGKQDNLIE